MKYQFTTEGSKSQTIYHSVRLMQENSKDTLFECVVSTPLPDHYLEAFLNDMLQHSQYPIVANIEDSSPSLNIMGLDKIARIISNIKPLKQKVIISICGEKKVYDLDAEKLETLLKSLE